VLSGVSPRICPWASLIYLLLSFAILINTQNIFCLLTLSNCSISSATDSTLPQSDIDSIHGQCAADFMKPNTDETKVRSTILTTYCLKQNAGTQMFFELLCFYCRLFLTVIVHPS